MWVGPITWVLPHVSVLCKSCVNLVVQESQPISIWSWLCYYTSSLFNTTEHKYLNKTKAYNIRNVYYTQPNCQRPYLYFVSLYKANQLQEHHTFEITGGKGFSFSNSFSASRNPREPRDKNFIDFHLFKLVHN
jgi:hypothetical protein